MSLAWSSVKALSIPVGGVSRDVKRVTAGGVTLWEKAPPLPYDAVVEYIESTGTQYIDTGVVLDYPGVDSTVEGEVLFTSTANRQLMGWNYGTFVGVNNGVMDGTTSTVAANTWHTMRMERIWAGNSSTISRWLDEVKVQESTTGTGSPVQHKFVAFGLQASSIFSQMCNAKVRWLRAYRAGVLVLDLHPVRVGSGANAVGYLYDRANPTGGPSGNGLYGNSGTGAFVVGPDYGTSLSMSPFLYLEETDLNPSDADATEAETQEELDKNA